MVDRVPDHWGARAALDRMMDELRRMTFTNPDGSVVSGADVFARYALAVQQFIASHEKQTMLDLAILSTETLTLTIGPDGAVSFTTNERPT